VATADLSRMGAPYNPRRISDHDLKSLRRSLRSFGTVEPIVVNRRSGRIVGGHQRVKAAAAEGMASLPVVYVDLDDHAEKQLNLALNRVSGEWDPELLGKLLSDLEAEGADLELTGFAEEELARLLAKARGGLTDPDEAPEPEAVALTQAGDLIALGGHRLLCGDATSADAVAALLGDVKPGLMVTNPPYGVDYDPAWRDEAAKKSHISYGDRAVGRVANDGRADWFAAWMNFLGPVAYVWHSAIHQAEVEASLVAAGFAVRSQIIWAKSSFAISRGHYHWQHEPCFYAVRKNATGNWAGDRSQSTLWSIPHSKSETGHGTQKPVECMRRPIENNSNAGQAVYDPFLGSGTTIIAAEMTGRSCYGLEIDPRYCDVIVKRWQAFTGKQAEGWRGNG